MSLNVEIPDTFSGPLDLLLHLIRRDEMDIHDIPIARLAASYIEEMRRLDFVNMDEATEFLDLAARLVEIKGKMLLPPEEALDGEEEGEDELDPRSGLVEALLEYRRFKEAARLLGELADEQASRYPRYAPRLEFHFVEESAYAADSMDLFAALQNMIVRLAPADEATEITYSEVPTAVRIEQIETVLAASGKTRFSLLLSGKPNRREMVGFFIALLELIRQGRVVARQNGAFSDIIVERREVTAPQRTEFYGGKVLRRPPSGFPAAAPIRRIPPAKAKPEIRPAFPAAASTRARFMKNVAVRRTAAPSSRKRKVPYALF